MVQVARNLSSLNNIQRFLGLLSLVISTHPVHSQETFFSVIFEYLGRPCNTDENAERCNGSGYVMKVGTDGTRDCQEKCAVFPLLNFGFSCGSCAPIPTRAPSTTDFPSSAPSISKAPAATRAPVAVVPNSESFDITIDLVGQTSVLSIAERRAFADSAERWQSIIKSGVSDVARSLLPGGPQYSGCAYPTVIDDMYICVRVAADDGLGGTLGFASPTYQRSSDGTTISGYVSLDIDDVRNLISRGTFDDVFTHEIGHILGIGTYFDENGVAGSDREGCPYFGVKASEEFAKISSCDVVPLETRGRRGDGTFCSHWSEACLQHELMTGTINLGGDNPISRVTIGSLEDLGYTNLDYSAADRFTSLNLGSGCNCRRRSLADVHPMLRSLVSSLVNGAPKDRRLSLSDDSRQYAYEKGLQLLRQNPSNVASIIGGFLNTTDGTQSRDSDIIYVGDRMVSVLVQDSPDGDIFGIHVYNPDYSR